MFSGFSCAACASPVGLSAQATCNELSAVKKPPPRSPLVLCGLVRRGALTEKPSNRAQQAGALKPNGQVWRTADERGGG
eukprot:8403106-Pyramimonas_sp.AAC.1